MSIQPPIQEPAQNVPRVAADDPEFLENVGQLEIEALERSNKLRSTAQYDNYAAIGLGILAPVAVAFATGLNTLSGNETLTASVLVAATVLTAAYAGWAPGGRATRNWMSHADFHLIAGRAGDLRAIHAKYLSLEEAARQLDGLRAEFAAAIRSGHSEQPTSGLARPSSGDRDSGDQTAE